MWNRKLCLYVSADLDMIEKIRLIGQAGFDGVFLCWNENKPMDDYAAAALENNLIIQSIHAPFLKAADMWGTDVEKGDAAVQELKHCLLFCAKYQVPIMVVHAFIGFNDHTPTAAGIERFGEVVETAKQYGIKIAFENTEGEEYLAALMDAFCNNPTVGFCWDTGHEMCYNHSKDMLKLYGDRLLCTHLNDNLGIRDFNGEITYIDDLHLLPFDGIADWDDIAARLKKHNFNDCLTFELNMISKPGRHENDIYGKMAPEDYFAECYKRACRVAAKCR
ncbi:MAG: sugar phosphate isomerase/epimerase [Lachnospiraceae bacterium]|nr:sugar phosphate isomerase/epimerase [Lachnospiraceae bacterium]